MIYRVLCLQLAHLSVGNWKDISIAHVIIIIKSEVSTFPIVVIFFRGCVPEMFLISYSVNFCIYSLGKPGICIHYYCAVYDECKWSNMCWLEDRIRVSVHYTISLSSLCKFIWRHCTYEMPVTYTLSSVWVRSSILSQLSIIQYVGLCVFSLSISLVIIERIYILCHHQIGKNYPLFRVKSWNNGMRCMSFYILIDKKHTHKLFVNLRFIVLC